MISLLRFLARYVRKHRWTVLLCLLLLGGDVWIAAVMPRYMSEIVDRGVLAGSMEAIRTIGIRMALVAVAGSVIGFLFSALVSVLSQKVSNDMRKDLFRKIHSLSFGQTDHLSSGALLTRIMTDTQIITQFGTALFQMLLKPAALFVVGFIMTVVISGRFAWIFVIAIPLQTVLLILFMKKLTPLFTAIQLKIEKINSRLQETFANIRLIKSYVRQDEENRRFRQDNTDLQGLNLDIQYTLAVMNPLIMLIINLVLIGIIAIGSRLVSVGEIDVGGIIAAIMYIQMIMMSLMTVGQIYQVAARAVVSHVRLQDVIALEPPADGTHPLDGPVREIEARGIGFTYPLSEEGSPPAVTGVSFRAAAGSFIAIVGPTGSGKSTLAAIAAGFLRPTAGSLLVNGREISEWTRASLQGRIVMVLQHSALCTGTIAASIRFGMEEASPEEVRQAAAIAQADGFISALPEQYDTPVTEKGTSLSGGQKQCIAIARALLRRPDMLILDDAASSIDLLTERALRTRLREAYPNLTLIVVTQRLASVRDADQLILLSDGRMAAAGTHGELMASSELYRGMYEAQQGGEEAVR